MLRSSHRAIKLSKGRAENILKIITESGARVRFVSKAQKSYEVYQLSFVLKTIQKFNIERKAKTMYVSYSNGKKFTLNFVAVITIILPKFKKKL